MELEPWIKDQIIAKSDMNNEDNMANVVWFVLHTDTGLSLKGPLPLTKDFTTDIAIIDMGGKLFTDLIGYFVVLDVKVTSIDLATIDDANELMNNLESHIEDGFAGIASATSVGILAQYYGLGGPIAYEQTLGEDGWSKEWIDFSSDASLTQMGAFDGLGGIPIMKDEDLN